MAARHVSANDLQGKVIDGHSHVGISLKSYAYMEYPYAQSLEDMHYRQMAAGVDVNVIFPLSAGLYFDPAGFAQGVMRPAGKPLSPVPYQVENTMMMREIFVYFPEFQKRFVPFVCVDPARETEKQLAFLLELERDYPIYGIKISAVECQSQITSLLDRGLGFVEFARERNIPFLLHTTADPLETYSRADLCFEVIEKNPDIRFCLAHCIGFHRDHLYRASALPNVWVDTSAFTIQVQCARENNRIIPKANLRFPADYGDHKKVLLALCEEFPETIIWGTDSPAYTYICQRKQGEGATIDFRLKAHYTDEKAALDSLPADLRNKICNTNTLRFLFGEPQAVKGDSIEDF
ncbi:MAG TPA: amidohydrolase family protein [Chloroflexota bacterium]|nr:amidohydrolase family protein [Chloroflexota bacterium]